MPLLTYSFQVTALTAKAAKVAIAEQFDKLESPPEENVDPPLGDAERKAAEETVNSFAALAVDDSGEDDIVIHVSGSVLYPEKKDPDQDKGPRRVTLSVAVER